MRAITREELIETLIKRRFPFSDARHFPSTIAAWSERKAQSRDHLDPEAAAEALKKQHQAREAFKIELTGKTIEQLTELFREELVKEEAQRLFNQPSAKADFVHYGRCARWTLDEAIALSLGKDPAKVSWGTVQAYVSMSAFAKEYAKRRDLVERARKAQQLFEPTPIGSFLHWCKRLGIALPDDLIRSAVNSGISVKGWQDLYEDENKKLKEMKAVEDERASHVARLERELDFARAANTDLLRRLGSLTPKTKDTEVAKDSLRAIENLQNIALLAALDRGFEPGKRNNAAKTIDEELAALELPPREDTIRNHVLEAAKRLPPDWRDRRTSRKPKSTRR